MRPSQLPVSSQDRKRRGTIAAFTAVGMTMMLGFTILAIDVGHLYTVRAELQNAADAAALAAASSLGAALEGDTDAAINAAQLYANLNPVLNDGVIVSASDVEYGRAQLVNGRYFFVPDSVAPDSVRVTVRRTDGSDSGPVPTFFAPLIGVREVDLAASAAAMMVPRDIALVADLSASHTDDSELAHYKITDINLWDVWAQLPGGTDPSAPGYTASNAGPLYGVMQDLGWGEPDIDYYYSPWTDPGLVYLRKGQDWYNPMLENMLASQNYSSSEINAIMEKSSHNDSYWKYRVGVALGLATWRSGLPGGKWQVDGLDPGNGNTTPGSSELDWVDYPFEGGGWLDYINNYMNKNTSMANANPQFKYRFGAKTFTNYLLEAQPGAYDTSALADTPVQPMQAVKEAVSVLTTVIDDLDNDDQLSLEVYDSEGHHEIDLTHDYHLVSDRLNEMQGGHYGSYTNMGAGIQKAVNELTSNHARDNAVKIIFLLTDGKANVNSTGGIDYEGGRDYAWNMAESAAAAGIRIYTITVGADADMDFMSQIAEMGNGRWFHAEGSIDEYSAELQDIFFQLGGTRPVILIE